MYVDRLCIPCIIYFSPFPLFYGKVNELLGAAIYLLHVLYYDCNPCLA